MSDQNKSPDDFCVSFKAKNIYSCLECVICGAHPYSFVEDKINRKYAKIELISRNSFTKYLGLLTQKFEESNKKDLSPRFGLIMDGWSESSSSTHYVTIFAAFRYSSNQTKIDLSSFFPLLSAEELSADSHMEFLDYVMGLFARTSAAILFLVGDNAPTNISLARKLDTNFIGCYSHRGNLCVIQLLNKFEHILRESMIL